MLSRAFAPALAPIVQIVQAFERGQNPAVYLRDLRTYDGTAGTLTKRPGSSNFASTPAVWVITNGKPMLASSK